VIVIEPRQAVKETVRDFPSMENRYFPAFCDDEVLKQPSRLAQNVGKFP
jgi:hypothetical protein